MNVSLYFSFNFNFSFGPKSRRRRFERAALMRNFLTIQEYDSEVGGGKPFCTRFNGAAPTEPVLLIIV